MFQEPLELLPLERWSELQSEFKKDGLRGIPGFSLLDTQKRLKAKGVDYGFTVYCPFGDVRNGMVGVNIKKNLYEIIILCPSDNTENIKEALRKTNIIDWQRPAIIVPFAPHNVIEILQDIMPVVDMEIRLLPSDTFILDNKQTPYEDVNLPENITFGLLSPEHVDLLDSTWPHRYPTSSWYFELLIHNQCGYGLFLDNTLICWVLTSEQGTLLHMYTIKEHRRKGFAELLLKIISNKLLKENRYVIAYCLKDNINACKLYTKAGFMKGEPIAWCYLKKKNSK